MSGTQATQILEAVAKAAEAASQAAIALKEANEQSRQSKTGFSEASKVVQCPKEFGCATSADDQALWSDFAFSFRQWLFFADPAYEPDFKHIEDNPGLTVTFNETAAGEASKERSRKLFLILGGILKHRPLKILRQVQHQNGLEAWRQLSALYVPRTKGRSLALLNAVMQFPVMTKDKTLLEQILLLERLSDEYTKSAGHQVAPDILLSTLVRILPKDVQRHVQLTMTEDATYTQVREQVLAHERISSTWSKDRVMADINGTALGSVTSYATGDSGVVPMEINQVKGKSKGKGQKGKGTQKGKGKDKGKSKDGGKGKGKSQQSGKGYGSPSKGGGKTQSKTADVNRCNYCGAMGHWKRDCRKFQADKANGVVRQVEADGSSQHAASSPSSVGTAQHSPSSSAYRSSGNVNRVAFSDSTVIIEDLTEFSNSGTSGSGLVRMLQQLDVTHFDMSCSDDDNVWTCSPTLHDEPNRLHHVRMMSFAGVSSAEIILDSGADTSALPLTYADVGESCQHETAGQDFIDAQGGKLDIRDTRLATVDLGNGVILRERFIIANISCPLLALGHIVRAGWELQHFSDGVFLVKNGKFVNVSFKRNSLCVKGSIRMISEDDCLSPTSTAPGPKALRAIHLQPVLRRLLPGWNKVNPQVYALTTRRARFVDTTLCPGGEMMWYRTTLVFRDAQGWELLEFGEPISELEDLEGEIYDPESVVEVLTLAHAHNVASEQLGFALVDGEQAPHFDADVLVGEPGDGDTGEQEHAPQPVQEVPAELPDAEPLDEERVVPFADESTVTVDGVVLSCDNTLKALRAGCEVLGLSKRGSKKECMRRMLEFVKTRELMEAHAVEATLKKDSERVAIPQKKPVEPTESMKQAHNLVHEPYETWCPLCVAHRAKQDGHKRQTHETTDHSVVSFDFFYCSRMRDESDKLTVLIVTDRDTGMCIALPTQQKGGRSLNYLVTEMCRFIVHCGHAEIGLRCDSEPSTLSLLEAVRKACATLRITAHAEPAPTGDHRANGAAEAMVEVIRAKANLLVSQIEWETGCKEPIFGCRHPVYTWAIVHSSWLHNHFTVKSATTAYERACGRFYSGKMAMFGEAVMGFLRTSQKGLPQWTRGVWLSKAISNDSHIIGTPNGVFLTRSIRRLPTSFDLELLGELTASPWNYGCASLGHRLVHAKRVVPPPAVAFDNSLRLPDRDAKDVQEYARAHPFEDVDETAISAEAGLLGQAQQPQDGEQDPIFNDEGLDEAIAAAKRDSKAQSMNVDVPQTPVYGETSPHNPLANTTHNMK